jgi:hypothetical protein
VHFSLKGLMVATTALLAAACSSTGTTGAGTATGGGTSPGAAGTSAATAPPSLDVTGTALGGGTPPSGTGTKIPTSPTSPASPASPTNAAGKATVFGCDRQPVSQPKTYTLACGDGGTLLEQLAWTGWGKAKATASGVQIQNSCQPSCAAGAPISTKAAVTLSGLSSGHYTKLSVVTAKGITAYTIDGEGPLITGAR